MKFAFVCPEGLTMSWWMRLALEGNEVKAWIKHEQAKAIGEGFIDRFETYEELIKWGAKDPNTVYVFENVGKGKEADKLRKEGKLVWGDSEECDKLEKDRWYGEQAAKECGVLLPKSVPVANFRDAWEFLLDRKSDEQWFFKPSKEIGSAATYGGANISDLIRVLEYFNRLFGNNIPGILQERIPGIPISTTAWWTGQSFITPILGMIEFKKLLNDNKGPNTGCSMNTVWAYQSYPKLAKELHFDKIAERFRKFEMPPGEYDVNAVVADAPPHKVYFLEWGPRMGYDQDLTYLQVIESDLGKAIYDLASGKLANFPTTNSELWAGLRISVPPYPWEEIKNDAHSALGVPISGIADLIGDTFAPYALMHHEDGLLVADPTGLVGVVVAKSNDFKNLAKILYKRADAIILPNAQYRTDYGVKEQEQLKDLKKWGFEVPKFVSGELQYARTQSTD